MGQIGFNLLQTGQNLMPTQCSWVIAKIADQILVRNKKEFQIYFPEIYIKVYKVNCFKVIQFIYQFIFIQQMTEEFPFQDFCSVNWLDSVEFKSQKNMNFTMSEVSKTNFKLDAYQQDVAQNWNIQEFNKKANVKLKNKINAKNFRQRKKTQVNINQKKIKQLLQENALLKKQKFCRHCKKPFLGLIKCTQTQKEQTKKSQLSKSNKSEEIQFQKPNFFLLNQKQQQYQNARAGKIWIALGILMLVIGIHLYGFRGKDNYKQISISKIQSQKWISNFQNKQSLDDYFNVKMKIKGQKYQKQKDQKNDQGIFKQIKILYEQEAHKKKQLQDIARNTIDRLSMVDQKYEDQATHKQEEISLHKQLLYSIQAQIDDIGNYL